MYRVTVTYGAPADPAAFDAHYAGTHVPIAKQLPGLRAYHLQQIEGIGADAPSYLIATLDFDDRDSALAALGSPEGQAAAGDIPNFASGGATLAGGEVRDALA